MDIILLIIILATVFVLGVWIYCVNEMAKEEIEYLHNRIAFQEEMIRYLEENIDNLYEPTQEFILEMENEDER